MLMYLLCAISSIRYLTNVSELSNLYNIIYISDYDYFFLNNYYVFFLQNPLFYFFRNDIFLNLLMFKQFFTIHFVRSCCM